MGDRDEIAITLDVHADATEADQHQSACQRRACRHAASRCALYRACSRPGRRASETPHVWRGAYGSIVTAVVRLEDGAPPAPLR